MSRPLRIEYPGAWYHVMNRGRRGENIFHNASDYKTFIDLLKETGEGWNLKTAGFCLLPDNYHLLVHTPDGNLSRCMRHINGIYTQRFNRRHHNDGSLFRGRYKAVLIEPDSHLLEVLRYIHRTPLRAGLEKELQDFFWSSHQGYISSAKKWRWLEKDFLLSILCETERDRKAAYKYFLSWPESEKIRTFYAKKNLVSIVGSDYFKKLVKDKYIDLTDHKEIRGALDSSLTADYIISIVCDYYRVEKEVLAVSKRGTQNLPRDMAIYLVRLHCRKTLIEIGRQFSISNCSTVSSAVERIKARKDKDRSLQKDLYKIGKILKKSKSSLDPPGFQNHVEIPEIRNLSGKTSITSLF